MLFPMRIRFSKWEQAGDKETLKKSADGKRKNDTKNEYELAAEGELGEIPKSVDLSQSL